ncbi:MAG TPA: hypothetical protein VM370_12430, partial [Candidatus Thermoplasmatota archaeon]|nr:hypothetical protein [Candidatus Thermoplasmatota archaeon]
LGEGPWERMSCGDSPRAETTLAPGETWPHRFSWDASYQAGPCEPGCDARRLTPADLGDHVVQVDLMLPNGSHAMASANVTVLPALLPELPPSGDIRILLDNATLRAGEAVAVRVQNVGNGTYAYNPYYEACGWRYYDDQARPFRIPPGTHCDLMGEQPIAPGATVDAFHWSLDECVIDLWGCGSAAPLAPGVYHIRARFCIYDGAFSASDTCVPVGASFRIE